MPKYHVVIKDAKVAHEKEVERNVAFNREAHPNAPLGAVENAVRARFKERPVGTVASVGDTECPDGMPNCRNCGDPQHEASCRAQGHCPYCGTRHGVAPDRIVAENGYELVEV